jgi:YD repeat-containing protein
MRRYDTAGNLLTVVRDAGPGRLNPTTAWTWNARGDPLTVTDPRGNVTTSTYDAGRRVLTTTTPAEWGSSHARHGNILPRRCGRKKEISGKSLFLRHRIGV